MLTPRKITTLPKGDQWVAMSTVTSPVTQIVDTAVNRASASGVARPLAEAIGSESRLVKIRMSVPKTRMAKREGDEVAKSRPNSPT